MSAEAAEHRSGVLSEVMSAGVVGLDEEQLLARCWYLERDEVVGAVADLVGQGVIARRGPRNWSLPSPDWSRRLDEESAFEFIAERAESHRLEGREFGHPKFETRHRVLAVEAEAVVVDRVDGNEPIRLTPDAAARVARIMNASGGTIAGGLLLGSAAEEAAFVELHPDLEWSLGGERVVASLHSAPDPRRTHLLTWNPANWDWDDLGGEVERTRRGEVVLGSWSCGNTRSILPGERAFIVRLGRGDRGLLGLGTVLSPVVELPHWDGDRYEDGDVALYLCVRWERLLDPTDELLSMAELQSGLLAQQAWSPQRSGIRIRDELVPELLARWAAHVRGLDGHSRNPGAEVRFIQDRDGKSATAEFESWCVENPEGYLIAIRAGKGRGMLHRVGCGHLLGDEGYAGAWNMTRRPKVCSTSRRALLDWAETNGVSSLPSCRDCKP